jgi:hypothetical protein
LKGAEALPRRPCAQAGCSVYGAQFLRCKDKLSAQARCKDKLKVQARNQETTSVRKPAAKTTSVRKPVADHLPVRKLKQVDTLIMLFVTRPSDATILDEITIACDRMIPPPSLRQFAQPVIQIPDAGHARPTPHFVRDRRRGR